MFSVTNLTEFRLFEYIDNKSQVNVVYTDFKKAFNTILIQKFIWL